MGSRPRVLLIVPLIFSLLNDSSLLVANNLNVKMALWLLQWIHVKRCDLLLQQFSTLPFLIGVLTFWGVSPMWKTSLGSVSKCVERLCCSVGFKVSLYAFKNSSLISEPVELHIKGSHLMLNWLSLGLSHKIYITQSHNTVVLKHIIIIITREPFLPVYLYFTFPDLILLLQSRFVSCSKKNIP